MEKKVRLAIMVAPGVLRELDEEAKARGASRSEVVQEGIGLLRKKRLKELGYPAKAGEIVQYGIGYG